MKLGQTFLDELNTKTSDTSTVPQLLAYIGGPGGTGKSQVIKAIQHLFLHCDKPSWLKSSAYTGTAASNINGRTLASLTLQKKIEKKDKHKSHLRVDMKDIAKLRERFGNNKFIIIDEVSMISTYQLSKLDARLKQARCSTLPFGGIHMLFFGDFIQYPPVCGSPLYRPITPPSRKQEMKTKKRKQPEPDKNIPTLKKNELRFFSDKKKTNFVFFQKRKKTNFVFFQTR